MDDLTGGPLDEVLARVRRTVPDLIVERLDCRHPTDDDNVYFLGDGSGLDKVQIDTAADGHPPFVIDADIRPLTCGGDHALTLDIDNAVARVCEPLRSSRVGPENDVA